MHIYMVRMQIYRVRLTCRSRGVIKNQTKCLHGSHLQPVVEVDESSTLQVQLVHDAEVRRCVGNPSVLREQRVILTRSRETRSQICSSVVCSTRTVSQILR